MTNDRSPDPMALSPSAAGLGVSHRQHNLLAICRDSRIVYLNAAGARLLGRSADEMADEPDFFSFVHRDYAELASVGFEALADETQPLSIKLMRPDQAAVDVELWVSPLTEDGDELFLVEGYDVTRHQCTIRTLRSRQQRLEGIINSMADGVITIDDQALIQMFNPAAEEIFGFSKEETVGRNIRSLIPDALPPGKESETDWVQALVSRANVTGKRKSGDTVPLEVTVREVQQGDQIAFTGIVRDISARKTAEERMFHMANHDPLTGLPNRHLIGDRAEEALKRAKRHRRKMALLFIDLDKFKPINDTFGHSAGDDALKQLAGRLENGVRDTDTVARVGGDEFMVLLEDLQDTAEAEAMRDKVIDLFVRPLRVADTQAVVGASIGIAVYPDDAEDINGLMSRADRDMYRAKGGQTS